MQVCIHAVRDSACTGTVSPPRSLFEAPLHDKVRSPATMTTTLLGLNDWLTDHGGEDGRNRS